MIFKYKQVNFNLCSGFYDKNENVTHQFFVEKYKIALKLFQTRIFYTTKNARIITKNNIYIYRLSLPPFAIRRLGVQSQSQFDEDFLANQQIKLNNLRF